MKVTVCPICRITPDITNTEIKCPKCGRMATDKDLNETVTNWNNGVVTEGKAPKVVIKDEDAIKEEPFMNEPVESDDEKEKKPIRKAKKPVKKGKDE